MDNTKTLDQQTRTWRTRLHEIIYESGTPAGKAFDVSLLVLILFSVVIVMLDSVPQYNQRYGAFFYKAEWVVTILFTLSLIHI